jgi:hypothetical protein
LAHNHDRHVCATCAAVRSIGTLRSAPLAHLTPPLRRSAISILSINKEPRVQRNTSCIRNGSHGNQCAPPMKGKKMMKRGVKMPFGVTRSPMSNRPGSPSIIDFRRIRQDVANAYRRSLRPLLGRWYEVGGGIKLTLNLHRRDWDRDRSAMSSAVRAARLAAVSVLHHDQPPAQTEPPCPIAAHGRLVPRGGVSCAMPGASAFVDYTSFWQANEQTRIIPQL